MAEKQPFPLLILSDAPSASSGLGRICRDLATRIHQNMGDVCKVATLGYGGPGSCKLGFPQYVIEGLSDWVVPTLPEVWEDFAGEQKGAILSIWDASRLAWYAQPERSAQLAAEPVLRNWLTKAPFKRFGYFPIDAEGPNGKLSFPLRQTLLGFDRVLAYGAWAKDLIERSIGEEEADLRHLDYLPHGIDTSVFYERDRAQCRLKFGSITGARLLINTPQLSSIMDSEVLVGCVEQGTMILTTDGEIPVEAVRIGDEIHTGSIKSVVVGVNPPRIPKSGELYELHAQGMCKPLRVTKEHPILCVPRERIDCTQNKAWSIKGYACRPWQKKSQPCGTCWNWEEMDWEPEFKPVSELVPGDFLALPIPSESHDERSIDTRRFSMGQLRKGKFNLPEKIELTPDLAFVIGLWAAEGSFQKQTRASGKRLRYGLNFTLNVEEMYLAKRIKEALGPLGCKVTIYNYVNNDHHKNTLDIKVSGRALSEMFVDLCGEGAHNKKFSRWIMELQPDLQKYVLSGFVAGDGHIRRDITHRITAVTVSRQLARQIWLMALRCGEPAGLHSSATVMPKTKKPGTVYHVTFYTEKRRVEKDSRRSFIYNGIFYTPVLKVGKVVSEGLPVFDLSVLGIHQYVANGICVHNCVATNQARKDWALAAEIVAILSHVHKIRLWIHTDTLERNWSIPALLADYSLLDKTMISLGYLSDDSMAQAYSACDVTLGVGAGEGMGYPLLESLACGTPVIHGNYAGGAEVVPYEMRVEPIAYHAEGLYACARPVFKASDWVDRALQFAGQRAHLDPQYDWNNLWPRWQTWLQKGIAA